MGAETGPGQAAVKFKRNNPAPPRAPESAIKPENKEVRKKQQQAHEVEEIGINSLTRRTLTAREKVKEKMNPLGSKDLQDDWAKQPENLVDFALSTVSQLGEATIDPAKPFQFDIGPKVTAADGVQIDTITASTDTHFTCKMADGSSRQMTREEVANAQIVAVKDNILSEVENDAQRRVLKRHIDSLQSGDSVGTLTEQQVQELDKEIIAVRDAAGLSITSAEAARKRRDKIAPDPSGIARTVENSAQLDEWKRIRDLTEPGLEGNMIDFDTWYLIYGYGAQDQAATYRTQAAELRAAAKKPGLKENERRDLEGRANTAELHQTNWEHLATEDGRSDYQQSYEMIQDGLIDSKNGQAAAKAAESGDLDGAIGLLYPELNDKTAKSLEDKRKRAEHRRGYKKWGKRGGISAVALFMLMGGLAKMVDE